jgi:hypothetical protein
MRRSEFASIPSCGVLLTLLFQGLASADAPVRNGFVLEPASIERIAVGSFGISPPRMIS